MRDMDSIWVVEMELYDKIVYHQEFENHNQAWKAYDNLSRKDKNYIITCQRRWKDKKVA